MSDRPELSARQIQILTDLVAAYIATGSPVGSRTLIERTAIQASPSTVRSELAGLEALGLLNHPHTSAGRVPTDAGYRMYAELLLTEPLGAEPLAVEFSASAVEIDTALRTTTEMLSHVTSLLALVTAPPLETTQIRRVEVLLLQPQVVMVVVITSTGGVTKKIFPFTRSVDPKLVEWAGEFLNDQVGNVRVGTRELQRRLDEPGLSPVERELIDTLRPAFTDLMRAGEQMLYVGGAARLLEEMRFADLAEINGLVRVLEERMELLEILRGALDSERVYVRVGGDNLVPHMSSLAMVAGNYGLATQNLGTVSLIGPTRMDYAAAIRSVRGATAALSTFVTEIYE